MIATFNHTGAIGWRVLRQLRRDHRFLALSLVAPVAIIYVLKVFFDSAESPMFDATQFIVPIGAFIIHFLTYVLTAIVLVRERTEQTLSRMFVNGYDNLEIIGGYLLAYSVLASLQSLLVLVTLHFLFDLDYSGQQYVALYGVMWLLAIISLALGIFISNFARNEGQVFPFIPLVILPSIFLSGVIISTDRLAEWAQWASRLTPLYYANQIIDDLITGGDTLQVAWGDAAGLFLYGVAILFVATLTLRELD